MMSPFLFALASAVMICGYNPDSGKPNPLGMRSYIEILVESPTRTRFLFDDFGNAAAQGAAKRELDIAEPLAKARAILRTNARAYGRLIDAPANSRDDSYRLLDPLMQCSRAKALDFKRANDPMRVRVQWK